MASYSGSNGDTGDSIMLAHTTVTDTTVPHALKLTDGRIYEDQLSGKMTQSQVLSTDYIKDTIGSIIQSGGVAFNPDSVGSTYMDFTYVAYGASQGNASETSAYIYAARYNANSVGTGVTPTWQNLTIAGLAEVTDVTRNELDGDSDYFLSERHQNLGNV